MSGAKWTPGPWSISNITDIFGPHGGDSGDGVNADRDDAWQVAEVGFYATFVEGQITELSQSVRDANAHLIAAAPEMADALRQWQHAEETGDDAEVANARVARDAALSKARGES